MMIGVVSLGVLYGFCHLLYVLFGPGDVPLSAFHAGTVSWHEHYTVVPTGTLTARIITDALFCIMLWLLTWMVVLLLQRASQNKQAGSKFAGVMVWGVLALFLWSVIGSVFIPKRLAVFDTDARTMTVKDYRKLFYVVPLPMTKAEEVVKFDEIQGFHQEMYSAYVMGADHDEAALYAITSSDTILVGRKMVYHAEFGWITDWRPHEEIMQSARQEGERAVQQLEDLLVTQP